MTGSTGVALGNWPELRAWRRALRAELLSRRLTLSRDERQRLHPLYGERLLAHFPELRGAGVGFYWPFKGEIDLRHLVRSLVTGGATAALPVVVEKQRPLEFWDWKPRMKMARGIWNIPIPAEAKPVQPTVLLVPLVGFDAAGYRLGYGGGYYDRTLAARVPRPKTIGVGYEFGRLPTIHPQPHDIPLDAIVTETQVRHFGDRSVDEEEEGGSYASPPCFMHELDPSFLG